MARRAVLVHLVALQLALAVPVLLPVHPAVRPVLVVVRNSVIGTARFTHCVIIKPVVGAGKISKAVLAVLPAKVSLVMAELLAGLRRAVLLVVHQAVLLAAHPVAVLAHLAAARRPQVLLLLVVHRAAVVQLANT